MLSYMGNFPQRLQAMGKLTDPDSTLTGTVSKYILLPTLHIYKVTAMGKPRLHMSKHWFSKKIKNLSSNKSNLYYGSYLYKMLG
eukprot:snap_masked-scaffold_2-processed-gene-27.35-mRNA-1 protein AED:1.00 eAED:1.00 QI:0/0/0/0/1/1/3/0/83